ncbi:MAG: FmdB family zinc ribbon protein [Candidatus Dormibacteria bacterium]
MPTYGYHCPHCQTEFEVFRRMTDDPGADCPRCGTAGRRLFSPTGIVFKGSGFYKTDSRQATSASVNGNGPAAGGKASVPERSAAGDTTATGEKTSAGEKASDTRETATRGETSTGGSTTT